MYRSPKSQHMKGSGKTGFTSEQSPIHPVFMDQLVFKKMSSVRVMALILFISMTVSHTSSINVSSPGNVVAGQPLTLECTINREVGDKRSVIWSYNDGTTMSVVYASTCTPSIEVSVTSPPGLSGGCRANNGEEVYTLTIQNVTVDIDGSSWECYYSLESNQVTLNVKEDRYVLKEVSVTSCANGQVALIWSSGIDNFLIEYYKLEYRGPDSEWTGHLVKNPGKLTLVKSTVTGLEPGVTYEFRVRPDTGLIPEEFVKTNCTVKASLSSDNKETADRFEGVCAAGVGVGVAVGSIIVTIIFLISVCLLRRTGRLKWNDGPSDQRTKTREVPMSRRQTTADCPGTPSTGPYEDLDTSQSIGPHYEEFSGNNSGRSKIRLYENTLPPVDASTTNQVYVNAAASL